MKKFIIGFEITKLSRKILRTLEAEIIQSVDKHMSATTARIICYIVENESELNIFQKDIEKFMGLNRASVSLTLNSMQKNGFIHRESIDNDARFKRIISTQKSLEYYQKIILAFDKVEDKMKIGIDDLNKLEDLLEKIDGNLEV